MVAPSIAERNGEIEVDAVAGSCERSGMKPIVLWLVAASLFWIALPAPTQRCPFSKELELHGRTLASASADRAAMITTISSIAFDQAESPLFHGPDGRARTALLMTAIARFESGFCPLVDTGRVRGKIGEACIMQVLVDARYKPGVGMVTAEGWTADDLVADRGKCVRAALHKLQTSFRVCADASSPFNDAHRALHGASLLTLYTSGHCHDGSPFARHRYDAAASWASAHPAPSDSP